MENHVHLLMRPKREESLYKMMQGITLCYTQYINRKYEKTGRLWESRYHSCIVDRGHYLWAAARYIEQNPKRAKIVKKEEEYPYSSASAHIAGRRDDILGEKLFNDNQRKDYIASKVERFCKAGTACALHADRPEYRIAQFRYHLSERALQKMR